MANHKCRVHAFVLYPDNEAQMRLHDWLSSHWFSLNYKYIWIQHKAETDEKKPHFHCMICFDNPRTPDGVRGWLGTQKTVWRLHKMALKDTVKEKLVKPSKTVVSKNGKPRKEYYKANTETGYIRETKWGDTEKPILTDPDDPQSYIEVDYISGEKICNAECKDDEVWRLKPIYTVPHVEKVSDRCSYALYMLHQTPDAVNAGKTRYEMEDIQGDKDFIESCFPCSSSENAYSVIQELMMMHQVSDDGECSLPTARQLLELCMRAKRYDLVEYIQKHHGFVKNFLCTYKN